MSLDSRSDELDRKLEGRNTIEDNINALVKDAEQRRRQIRLLTLSIIVELIIVVGLVMLSIRTMDLAALGHSNKAALMQNCETANDSRKSQRKLWGYILAVPPSQPRSPEQELRVQEFKEFVDNTFAPRDCVAEANVTNK